MNPARERILARLRENLAQAPSPWPAETEREAQWLRLQPRNGDLAGTFCAEAKALGVVLLEAETWKKGWQAACQWLQEAGVKKLIMGEEKALAPLKKLLQRKRGFELETYTPELSREAVFDAECGITTAHAGIAEAGSLLLLPSPAEPRLLSLAPPLHLAFLSRQTLFPYLLDFLQTRHYQETLPANLVLITGPSRTADIEYTLSVGVHGPKQVVIVLVDAPWEEPRP